MDVYAAEHLPNLPPLTRELSLSLYDGSSPHPLTDADLAKIPKMPDLEALSLGAAGAVTTKALAALTKSSKGLRRLELGGVEGGAAALAGCFPGLEALTLRQGKISKAELTKVVKLGLKELGLFGLKGVGAGALTPLADVESVETLTLWGLPLGRADGEALATMPRLTTLTVRPGYKIKADAIEAGLFEALGRAPSLTRLDPGRPLTAGEAEALAAAPSLRQLVVHIRDEEQLAGLAPLGRSSIDLILTFEDIDTVTEALLGAVADQLPKAASLEVNQGSVVNRGKGINAAGLAHIGKMTGLRRLFIRGSWKLKNDDLAFIEGLTELEVLDLHHLYKLSAGIVGTLVKLPRLRALNLAEIKLTDGAAKKLATLPLEAVNLTKGKIGDKALAAMASIPTLRKLDLSAYDTQVGDEGLAAISKAPALEELWLSARTATVAGFEALASLHTLRRLQLTINPNTPLDDQMVGALAAAPALEELGLTIYCSLGDLTDAVLERLAACPSLRRLDLPKRGHQGSFSEAALAAFREKSDALLTLEGNSLFYVRSCPEPRSWLDEAEW